MTDIDYELLAKAAYDTFWAPCPLDENGWSGSALHPEWDDAARAVVAALRDQGFSVVATADLAFAIEWGDVARDTPGQWVGGVDEPPHDRISAAYLAAPGDGETT
jgi:hypothetical protein